jgi:hypothetical protein
MVIISFGFELLAVTLKERRGDPTTAVIGLPVLISHIRRTVISTEQSGETSLVLSLTLKEIMIFGPKLVGVQVKVLLKPEGAGGFGKGGSMVAPVGNPDTIASVTVAPGSRSMAVTLKEMGAPTTAVSGPFGSITHSGRALT